MNSKNLVIFAVITVVAILAATLVGKKRAPSSSLEKEILFSELSGQINDVHRLRLEKHGKTLGLVKTDTAWVIEEADNYPANFGKIKETVIAVSKLMILARKTSNPDLYRRLGVEDPLAEDANSLLLSLQDDKDNELATVIVGNTRHSKSADSLPGLYVRLPADDSALLVEGRIDVSAESRDWIDRELMDIDAAQISKIVIEHKDGPRVSLHRAEDIDDFTLDNIPEGKEMQSAVIISRISTMLESLSADGVVSADRIKDQVSSTATLSTFDGLDISISSAVIDDIFYAGFSVSARQSESTTEEQLSSADEAGQAEQAPTAPELAKSLNQKLAGWAYIIPDYKFELFTQQLEELVRGPEQEQPSSDAEQQ